MFDEYNRRQDDKTKFQYLEATGPGLKQPKNAPFCFEILFKSTLYITNKGQFKKKSKILKEEKKN